MLQAIHVDPVLVVVPLVRRGVVCADGSRVSSLGGGCGSSLCGGGVSSG